MPNWCFNHLTISGPEEAVSNIAKACRMQDNCFDFNGIVPMPEELDITSGSAVDSGLDVLYGDWQKVAQIPHISQRLLMANDGKLPETREDLIRVIEKNVNVLGWISLREARQAKANLERFGYKDWYEWRIDKWGTKWNACDVDVETVEPCFISVWFSTAWAPPIPLFEALCAQHPRVSATLRYIEPGFNMAGTARGEGGVVEDYPEDDIRSFGEEHFGLDFDEE